MAVTVETLETKLSVNSSGFDAKVNRASKTLNKLDKQERKTTKSTNKLSDSLKRGGDNAALLSGPMGGVASRMSIASSAIEKFGIAGAAAAVGGAALFAVLVKGVGAASALESQMLKIEALIKATGGVAGFSATQIDELARSIDASTLASAAGVRDAAAILLTFKKVQGTVFKETLVLAQDMAAVMGTDIKQATLQFAKALEDPTIGLNLLRRAGVSFTQAEKDKIKVLTESGRLFEAQNSILAKVRGQIGGAGAGAAGGMAGSVDMLSMRWTEMLENIGQSFIFDIAKAGIDGLAVSVQAAGEMIKGLSVLLGEQDAKLSAAAIRADKHIEKLNDIAEATRKNRKELPGLIALTEKHLATLDAGSPAYERTRAQLEKINKQFAGLDTVVGDFIDKSRAARAATDGLTAPVEIVDKAFQAWRDTLVTDEQATDALIKKMDELNARFFTGAMGADELARRQLALADAFTSQRSGPEQAAEQAADPAAPEVATSTLFIEQLQTRFDALKLSLQSEETEIAASEERRLLTLQDAEGAFNLTEQESQDIRASIMAEGNAKRTRAEERELSRALGFQVKINKNKLRNSIDFLGNMTNASAAGNKAMFRINKAARLAQAVIAAKESVVASFTYGSRIGGPILGGIFAGVAAAAQAANIASIASSSFSGGGAPTASSVGDLPTSHDLPEEEEDPSTPSVATEPAAPAPAREVTISLTGDSFSTDQVVNLAERMSELAQDGRIKLNIESAF